MLVLRQQNAPITEEAAAVTTPASARATATAGQALPPPQVTAVATATTTVTAASSPTPTVVTAALGTGALIQITMESEVGVLLDELPEMMRDRVVEALLERPEAYWTELARRQIRLTTRRLDFRNFAYSNKGQLPLPPEALWSFELDASGPARRTVQGHDLLIVSYTFSTTLLADTESPGAAEPALAQVGGVWDEPFVLPFDPDLLLQRTGNACLNEAGYPPNSYDSENAWVFYDYTCQADSGGPAGCHRTRLPNFSCQEALANRVGALQTAMRFERVAWDADLADQVRLGPVLHQDAPDVMVVGEDLETHRIIYRYFAPDACAIAEQCVGGAGWRRLLQFEATVHNVGAEPLHIGAARAGEEGHNLFHYDACHDHFHFINYGDFFFGSLDETAAGKQAFCVQSTGRYSNNEASPLTHDYSCRFQGVQAGWADEYIAGLDCQWVDITDNPAITETATLPLTFRFNADRFLCEGTPVIDEEGNVQWEPSDFTTEAGAEIRRPQCDFVPEWDVNNMATRDVTIPPQGSFVTMPCSNDILGPLRNCGFMAQEAPQSLGNTCAPGSAVQLTCSVADEAAPQVLRVCETSAVLGTGVACAFQEALLSRVISGPTQVSFTCPFARDAQEPGGSYAFYTAPVFADDPAQPVRCTQP